MKRASAAARARVHDASQAEVFDALGNPMRRAIVRLLAPGPQPVGAIAAQLPVSRPAVSKHLRVLQSAELVAYERRGNRNPFRLQPMGFEAARRWLDQFWDVALARFVMVAENTAEAEPDDAQGGAGAEPDDAQGGAEGDESNSAAAEPGDMGGGA